MRTIQGPSRFVWHRTFDIAASLIGLVMLWPLVMSGAVVAAISTRDSPIFRQTRIGKDGRLFQIAKLRTMRERSLHHSTVTTANDPRITTVGGFLRRYKLDEIPQLWNVLKGEMSIVGPRPDVPGYADELDGWAEQLLSVRPGITGPATLLFRNEEALLARAQDPEYVNRAVIYPIKTLVNLAWLNNATLFDDLKLIWMTVAGGASCRILDLVEQWEPGLTSQPPMSEFLSWLDGGESELSLRTRTSRAGASS